MRRRDRIKNVVCFMEKDENPDCGKYDNRLDYLCHEYCRADNGWNRYRKTVVNDK